MESITYSDFVYFAHSYAVIPDNPDNILALTKYGSSEYCSVIKKDNIYGCQFHLEKSSIAGLRILEKFFY